jgi:hypothetical protein
VLKTTARTIVWIAVALALLTALVGVTPTEAGEFVRGLWGNVLEFFQSVFQGGTPGVETPGIDTPASVIPTP